MIKFMNPRNRKKYYVYEYCIDCKFINSSGRVCLNKNLYYLLKLNFWSENVPANKHTASFCKLHSLKSKAYYKHDFLNASKASDFILGPDPPDE